MSEPRYATIFLKIKKLSRRHSRRGLFLQPSQAADRLTSAPGLHAPENAKMNIGLAQAMAVSAIVTTLRFTEDWGVRAIEKIMFVFLSIPGMLLIIKGRK
jgi:hypothetical protein